MNEDIEDSPQARGLLNTALTGEPPLVDMVYGAVDEARRRKQRDRIAMGVAPVAVLALAVTVYTVGPRWRGGVATSSAVYATSTTQRPPAFPPVSPTSPMNPSSGVHQAGVEFCKEIKHQDAGNMNVVPQNDDQAVFLCQMTMDMVGTLFPDAVVSFAPGSRGTWGEGNEVVLTTGSGASKVRIAYLWPAHDKVEYHTDKISCDDFLHPATTYADSTMPINPAMLPHDVTCVYTSPAPRLQGVYVTSEISGDVSYFINDTQGGRYIIETGPVSPEGQGSAETKPYQSAYNGNQWSKAFSDPRFGAFLRDDADYVLAHSAMKWPKGAQYP